MPVFGGYLVDRIGNRFCNILYTLLVAIGQSLFAFGVTIKSYPLALGGRAIYGIGAESLNISQFNIINGWLSEKELSMGLAFAVTINRISTSLNDNLSPHIAQSASLDLSLWVGFGLCCISLLCALLIQKIDKKKDLLLGFIEQRKLPDDQKFDIRDIKTFGASFWLLSAYASIVYDTVYCFNNIASNYFQERFGYSSIQGGIIISITFITCALFCPIIGKLLDKYGRRIYHILASAFLVTLSHCLFFFTPDSNKPIAPVLYMIPLGFGFSICSAVVWSSISYLVLKGSGTAYGVILSMMNASLVVFPVMVGYIKDNTNKSHGYYWVSFFLLVLGCSGILVSLILYVQNKGSGGILHNSVIKDQLILD